MLTGGTWISGGQLDSFLKPINLIGDWAQPRVVDASVILDCFRSEGFAESSNFTRHLAVAKPICLIGRLVPSLIKDIN
jgi:hypothetical protein